MPPKWLDDFIGRTTTDQLRTIMQQNSQILKMLQDIQRKEAIEMATITDVAAKVAAETTVVASAVTLLNQLSQMLKDAIAAGDPAAIQAVADAIDANTANLAAAVTANTPAA